MKILFTIAGRAGSKGIKNKNIRDFCGKPLPFYALSAIDLYAKRHAEIDIDIAVNSDSDILLGMFADNPIRDTRLIKRAANLSGDSVGKFLVIRDCLEKMEERTGAAYDMVVDLDITSPIRTVANIEELTATQRVGGFDAVFSVTDARRNPYFNMVTRGAGGGYERVIASNFTARQQAPEIYDMNASMYAYKPAFLREKDGLFDGVCGIIKMIDTGILDLDHESDFELMEAIARHYYSSREDFAEIRDNI
jgi:CMP-N,N'-diacetyllegionaminic acid synthase